MRIKDSEYLTLLILAIPFLLILIIKIIDFFVSHYIESRYIISEMKRSDTTAEYSYWRRQLTCHRLCLLPFINPNNVERFYNIIFGRHGKH